MKNYEYYRLCLAFVVVLLVATDYGAVARAGDTHPAGASDFAVSADDSPVHGGLVWQGFHFAWLRRVLGAQTPHRMGTQRHYLDQTGVSGPSADPWKASADFHVTFTPGVDGDFQHPKAMSAAVYAPGSSASFSFGSRSFFVQDNSTLGAVPHADLEHEEQWDMGVAAGSSAELLLAGYEVEMHCVGSDCNSSGCQRRRDATCRPPLSHFPLDADGIWAYHWHISVDSGEADPTTGSVACSARLEIGRGWTPSHGGGKAYNPQMNYTVTIHYALVELPAGAAHRDTLSAQSTLFEPLTTGTRHVTGASGSTQVVGVRGFEFTLTETNNQPNRGRYFEELAFFVQDAGGMGPTGVGSYNYTMGVASPKLTTYASDVALGMNTSLLTFPAGAVETDAAIVTSATICEDDPPLFHCSAKGLPESLSDTVPITYVS